MEKAFHVNPVVRSVGVISAVAVLVGGVTFAALQSRATLTDNTISSASANLLVDGNVDGQFNEEEPGFAFEGIVPGVTPSEAHEFALQNNGDAGMKVKAMVVYNGENGEAEDPQTPEVQTMTGEGEQEWDPTMPVLPEGVEASDITFIFTPEGGEAKEVTWEQLSAWKGKKILDSLGAGETRTMTVQVSIDESVHTSGLDIGSFDIVFTGKAVASTDDDTPEEPEESEEPAEEIPAPEEETPTEEPPAEEVPEEGVPVEETPVPVQ